MYPKTVRWKDTAPSTRSATATASTGIDLTDPLAARLLASDLRVGIDAAKQLPSGWARKSVLAEQGSELMVDVEDEHGTVRTVIISVRVVQ